MVDCLFVRVKAIRLQTVRVEVLLILTDGLVGYVVKEANGGYLLPLLVDGILILIIEIIITVLFVLSGCTEFLLVDCLLLRWLLVLCLLLLPTRSTESAFILLLSSSLSLLLEHYHTFNTFRRIGKVRN